MRCRDRTSRRAAHTRAGVRRSSASSPARAPGCPFGYQLLAFPLGLAYFVFLVVAFSVGHLADHRHDRHPAPRRLDALLWRLLARFERLQARGLLGARVPSGPPLWRSERGLLAEHQGPDRRSGRPGSTSSSSSSSAPSVSCRSCSASPDCRSCVAFIGAPFMQQFGWFTIAGERVDFVAARPGLRAGRDPGAVRAGCHVMNAWGYVSARLAEAAARRRAGEARRGGAAGGPSGGDAAVGVAGRRRRRRCRRGRHRRSPGSNRPGSNSPGSVGRGSSPWPPQAPGRRSRRGRRRHHKRNSRGRLRHHNAAAAVAAAGALADTTAVAQAAPWQQPWGPPPWPPQALRPPQQPDTAGAGGPAAAAGRGRGETRCEPNTSDDN